MSGLKSRPGISISDESAFESRDTSFTGIRHREHSDYCSEEFELLMLSSFSSKKMLVTVLFVNTL
jgi:hypothetical protein